jgi:hypothetical protein
MYASLNHGNVLARIENPAGIRTGHRKILQAIVQ